MRNAYTYASILSAVGRVLDEAGVKRFAITPSEDGLVVEGFDAPNQVQRTWRYDVPALYELVSGDEHHTEHHAVRTTTHDDDGTLRDFLRQRQLVGAR